MTTPFGRSSWLASQPIELATSAPSSAMSKNTSQLTSKSSSNQLIVGGSSSSSSSNIVAKTADGAIKGGTSSAGSTAGSTQSTKNAFKSRFTKFQATRVYRSYAFVARHRKSFLFGASVLYLGVSYTSAALHARKRDRVHDPTYLYWRIHDGSIVEAKGSASTLSNLLFSSPGGSDEPARVMTLFEVVRGINWAMRDDRVVSRDCPSFLGESARERER